MWGKRGNIRLSARPVRSTPTRVGKTSTCRAILLCCQVHPHACGENIYRLPDREFICGPPPRVWGKRQCNSNAGCFDRSTPTRVGKTCIAPLPTGEKRSTPTRVGKTHTVYHMSIPEQVHPHACGENAWTRKLSAHDCGPPPRVWGKHIRYTWTRTRFRSTPTRVGKTYQSAALRA